MDVGEKEKKTVMLTNALSDNWVALSKEKYRDVFSEIDVLLRALDRFFTVERLSPSKGDAANKNFFDELSGARDVIHRVLGLLETVIPESKRNVYWFQKFAVAKYLNDKKRDAFQEELYKQDIPEKSLLLLYDSFINLKGIISDILRTEHIPYLTFTNMGQVIGKDLRENIHFNPFKKDLNPEFDVIENREVSKVVKGIRDREIKKSVSVLLLYLFKFLRYLRYADNSNKFGSLSPSLLVILLLRSEIAQFRAFIEKISGSSSDGDLGTLMKSISYQFSIESKRVFEQELKEPFIAKSQQRLKGKIENSHGILKNLSEQSAIQIVQFFRPDISGSKIFESFTTRLEQSLRLRDDLHILHRFLILLEAKESAGDRFHVFAALKNFMLYFQSFTFKLLRHDDYEQFSSFFDKVLNFRAGDIDGRNFGILRDGAAHFRIFVETCLRQLSNRAELIDRPVNMKKVEAGMRQYLP